MQRAQQFAAKHDQAKQEFNARFSQGNSLNTQNSQNNIGYGSNSNKRPNSKPAVKVNGGMANQKMNGFSKMEKADAEFAMEDDQIVDKYMLQQEVKTLNE